MFTNLHETLPEFKFYLLINKLTNEEHHVTMTQLNKMYGEEKVIRMMNSLDTHWLIVEL